MTPAVTLDVIGEAGGYDGRGRDAVIILQSTGEFGDTRRAAVSATDAEDGGVAVFLYLLP